MLISKKKEKEIGNALNVETITKNLSAKFPLGYIPRSQIGVATGGLLSPKTMANYDKDKTVESVVGTIKIGGKVCYPIQGLISFLESRVQDFEQAI